MKKVFKYLAIAAAAAFALYSCATKEQDMYTPAAGASGTQYYFPKENPTEITISDATKTVDFTVKRAETVKAEDINVSVKDPSGKIFFNNEGVVVASFAKDADGAVVSIPIDITKFEYGDKISLELQILSEDISPYRTSVFKFSLSYPEPWVSLGKGIYRDDMVSTFYSVDPEETWEVEILESANVPGVYAVVNPYGENYPYNDPGDWDTTQDYKMIIHAEDPTAVYVSTYVSEMAWSYGTFVFASLAGYYMERGTYTLAELKEKGYTGTLVDGIITMPVKSMLIAMTGYNNGNLYNANLNGLFRVVLPGVELADYSVSVEYTGLFTDKEGDVYAFANVELGPDVKEARLVLIPGDDPEAAVPVLIENGDDVIAIEADGEVKVALPETLADYYTFVIASFDEEGEMLDAVYDTFAYKDFSAVLTVADPEVNADFTAGTVKVSVSNIGEAVEEVKLAIATGAKADAAEALVALIKAGEDAGIKTLTEEGDVVFDLTAEGKYTVAAITFAEGQAVNVYVDEFEFNLVDPWNYLGKGTITDGFMFPVFSKADATVECDFYEYKDTPGRYKVSGYQLALISAFFGYPETTMANYKGQYWDDTSFEVDATKSDAVVIIKQEYGLMVNSDYGWSKIDTEATGTLANGEITWPAKEMYVYLGGWYYGNTNGTFKLTLPAKAPAAPVVAPVYAGSQTLSSTIFAEYEVCKENAIQARSRYSAISVARGKVSRFAGEFDKLSPIL